MPNSRIGRILRELHGATEANEDVHPNYYSDMKIFTLNSNLDIWRVFLLGPEGTLYANKWWCMHITFHNMYPIQAPNIKFITVPYHINISSNGKICMDSLNRSYEPSKHVVDIIQEMKELFLMVDTMICF